MTSFRDRVALSVVDAASHPIRAHAMLCTLFNGMAEKLRQFDMTYVDTPNKHDEFRRGMVEMIRLVQNLRDDIAHDYGIEEGKK